MGIAVGASEWSEHDRALYLLDAARAVGSSLDESRIYSALVELLQRLAPIDGVVVSAFDTATELIHCQFAWADGAVVDTAELPPIRWNRSGSGMQGRVILTGQAEIFDIPTKIAEPQTSYVEVGPEGAPQAVGGEGPQAQSAMMAPMILEGAVAGVIQVMSNRRHAFNTAVLEALEALTTIVTPAWHNARMFERAGQDRRLTERILATSPDVVFIFNLDSLRIEFANGQIHKQFGYSDVELAEMGETSLLEVMAVEDHEIFRDTIRRLAEASDSDLVEAKWRVSTKTGDWRWVHNRIRVFERHSDGRPVRVLGFAMDVTEQEDSARQLRETQSLYRMLAEAGPFPVWSATAEGVIDYINDRWRTLFGPVQITDAEARRALIHDDDRERTLTRYREAILSGQEFEIEYRLKRIDGRYGWFLIRGVPVRDDQGEVTRWLGTLIDQDGQKETEKELEERVAERTAELEEAVKELEGFTYTVSHDLRGPLRAISGASMILREDFGNILPAEAQRHLLRQAEAARKMGALIDDLLKLSRIGRQEMRPTPFNLSQMALDVTSELGITQRTHIQEGMDAIGDPRLIRFVLLNLLENAVKFTHDDSVIRIGFDGEAYFVEDQGVGFEMDYVEKIFLPFERLVSAEDYPGTGIGLANVHRIVTRHGGRIWAQSGLGKGATFYFTLGKGARVDDPTAAKA